MVLGALAIGLALGLLGSGGSILTVPILVYGVGRDDKIAIAESLAIVGTIALFGSFSYARTKEIDWRSVVLFGIPGMLGTYAGAWIAQFISGGVQLLIFSGVMLLASYMMLRPNSKIIGSSGQPAPYGKVAVDGFVVGVVTGLVGVGGGFLIIPALVLLGGLPMRRAVGSSLVIIALKSFTGFIKYQSHFAESGPGVDWNLISVFATVGVLGSFLGNAVSSYLDQRRLKQMFGVFLIFMGLFVLVKELPGVLADNSHSNGMVNEEKNK
jgi:hypothetical protein